jgi:hypothetical protein
MRPVIYALFLLLAVGCAGSARAGDCRTPNPPVYSQLSQTDIAALLGGNTACNPVGGPPWENQEAHSGSPTALAGNVIDYKKGPGDPIDPSKQIGSYSISGSSNGTIQYTYDGGGSFTYQIWGATPVTTGTTYDFCNGGTPLPIAVQAGTSGCH